MSPFGLKTQHIDLDKTHHAIGRPHDNYRDLMQKTPTIRSNVENHRRILVGVCTYNESENVHELLSRILGALPGVDILVVDDSSPDGTAAIVRQFAQFNDQPNVRCLVRDRRGLGGAIRAAMRESMDGGYEWFCNLDGDLSHDPADLPRLIDAVLEQDADVAVGSRYVTGGEIIGWPRYRRWMSRAINSITRRRLRLPIKDASGSFRCYRVDRLKRLNLDDNQSEGYSFLQQVLLDLHRDGAKVIEVPITFTERVSGSSKLNFREAVRSGWTVFTMKT